MKTASSEVKTEALGMDESRRLVELERRIEGGLVTFIEVGEALMEIRDSRLYRIEYGTFEDYCREKWKMSDRRARQLMDASSVVEAIGKSGTIVPKSESQVRPITKLEPEQQPAAWDRAVEIAEGKQPTARQVEQAVVEEISNKDNTADQQRRWSRRCDTMRTRKRGEELERAWKRATEHQQKRLLGHELRVKSLRVWIANYLKKFKDESEMVKDADPVTHARNSIMEELLTNRSLMQHCIQMTATNFNLRSEEAEARKLLDSCYDDESLAVLQAQFGDDPMEIMNGVLGLRTKAEALPPERRPSR